MRKGTKLIALLAALMLVAASCGDGDTDTTPADAGDETAPADAGDETAPADAGDETAPADAGDETAPADAGDETTTESDRLILAMTPASPESNRAWATGLSVHLQVEPFLETLMYNDAATGAVIPRLATEWTTNDDFTEWTFKLREGVQFHFGHGEFTAADVAFSLDLLKRDDSITTTPIWAEAELEILDDYEVVFKFPNPMLQGNTYFSRTEGDLFIYSAAQVEAEGIEGIDTKPAGTGRYQYVERRSGEYILFEAFEDHWSDAIPAFDELQMLWVPEVSTRLALMISGDAHVAQLTPELIEVATASGLNVLQSGLAAQQTAVWFGGNYHSSDTVEDYDPTVPWAADVKVREALNIAINRDEINDVVYGGRGTLTPIHGFDPRFGSWNSEWDERFEEAYGYDPDRARALLEESAFPIEEINVKILSFSLDGNPEIPVLAEVLQQYYEQVGIRAEIEVREWVTVRQEVIDRQWHEFLLPLRNQPVRQPEVFLRSWYNKASFPTYTDDFIYQGLEALDGTVDLNERDSILREMGDFIFENYTGIPLVARPLELVVNPQVIGGWLFPGGQVQPISHYEEILRP